MCCPYTNVWLWLVFAVGTRDSASAYLKIYDLIVFKEDARAGLRDEPAATRR